MEANIFIVNIIVAEADFYYLHDLPYLNKLTSYCC